MAMRTQVAALVALIVFGFATAVLAMQLIFRDHIHESHSRQELATTAALLMATREAYRQQLADSLLDTPWAARLCPSGMTADLSRRFSPLVGGRLTFANVSERPRNAANQADAAALKAIAFFRREPGAQSHFSRHKVAGEQFFQYALPLKMGPACMNCHGARNAAPAAIRNSYDSGYDYLPGELRGILHVRMPVSPPRAIGWHPEVYLGGGLAAILLYLFLVYELDTRILARIRALQQRAEKLGRGDFTPGQRSRRNRRDAIDRLEDQLEEMALAIQYRKNHREEPRSSPGEGTGRAP